MQHSQQIGIGSNYTQTKQCFYQNYVRFDLSNIKNHSKQYHSHMQLGPVLDQS